MADEDDSDFMDWAETEAEHPDSAPLDGLDALRWNWGTAYEIEPDDVGYRARRRDGLGDWMTADGLDTLRNDILSDYLLKPMKRPDAGETPS
jgi:hypothetical protein